MKPGESSKKYDIYSRAKNSTPANKNVDGLKNAKHIQRAGQPLERLKLAKRIGKLSKSVGARVYFMAVFVFMVIVFVWIGFNWVKSDANLKSVEEILKNDLLKNPVKSVPLSNSQNTNASQNQTAQTSQTAQNVAQTSTSQSDSAVKTDDANTNVGATTPENNNTKKFESAALKVSFDYPAGMTVSEGYRLLTLLNSGTSNAFWKIRFYENKNKKELKSWYLSHFEIKNESDCTFADATIKAGTYESKLVKVASETVKCDGEGSYAINTDKSRIIRIETGKEMEENINKILTSFKFID
jgi:hypothetical protein